MIFSARTVLRIGVALAPLSALAYILDARWAGYGLMLLNLPLCLFLAAG